MVTVLRAAETLTKCICMLHRAGMVHRDIKPSNFGFVKRGSEVLTQTLSMFDVDSICSVYDAPEEFMGTEGFAEPEAEYEDPTNLTDIYSIGATLFYAVAASDEVKDSGFCYQKEYYPRLRELVNMSDLVCASEANAHPRLRDALTRILEKSLGPRGSRYHFLQKLRKKPATGRNGCCRTSESLWTGTKKRILFWLYNIICTNILCIPVCRQMRRF